MNKTIIFDMDGVLLDTERMFLNIWTLIGQKHNINGLGDTVYKCLGVTGEQTRRIVMETYGPDFPYEEFKKETGELFTERIKKDGVPVKKGARELLQFLKINGWDIALATSTRSEIAKDELESVGFWDFFKEVVTGEMVRESKPHPEIYFTACERLGVTPNDVIAIEDSKNGVRAAAMAGLKVILVPDLVQPDEDMERLAWKVFNDLNEVRLALR